MRSSCWARQCARCPMNRANATGYGVAIGRPAHAAVRAPRQMLERDRMRRRARPPFPANRGERTRSVKMENSRDHNVKTDNRVTTEHRITSVDQLRTLLGHPHPTTPRKLLRALDDITVD